MDSPPIRVIASVLRGAQSGELPLFAWTLGLPQAEHRMMLLSRFPHACCPALSATDYARIGAVPEQFPTLSGLLQEHCRKGLDGNLAEWLSRAIAAACFGHRALWKDLDMHGLEELDWLFTLYFRALSLRHSSGECWKRFLFAELTGHVDNLTLPVCLPANIV